VRNSRTGLLNDIRFRNRATERVEPAPWNRATGDAEIGCIDKLKKINGETSEENSTLF